MKTITLILISILTGYAQIAKTQIPTAEAIEKSYIHTDKPIYAPGDDLWYRASLFNGDNLLGILSEEIIIELKKPDGTIASKSKLVANQGMVAGQILLKEEWPGGVYLLSCTTAWNAQVTEVYQKKIIIQKVNPPRILMSMDLNQESYIPGEIVSADMSYSDLQGRPLQYINIAYQLQSLGKVLSKSTSTTDVNGKATIELKLNQKAPESNVILVAQVAYRGQSESISRTVPTVTKDIDLQFLPEGGFLLRSHPNKVAFKALASNGKPAEVEGIIRDQNDQQVGTFKSTHDGMGYTMITPVKGKEYSATLTKPYHQENIHIGDITTNGCKIELTENTSSHISYKVLSSAYEGISVRLKSAHKTHHESATVSSKAQTITTEELASGVYELQCTVDNEIVSSRLLYIDAPNKLKINIKLDKESYGLRSKVIADISTEIDGEPIAADLVISAVEDKLLTYADDKQAFLQTHLQMSWALQGVINEPNYYYTESRAPHAERMSHLDLVMLTHGWKNHLKEDRTEEALIKIYEKERHIGQVKYRDTSQTRKTKLLVMDRTNKTAYVTYTDDDGFFSLPAKSDLYTRVIADVSRKEAIISPIRSATITKKSKMWRSKLIGHLRNESNEDQFTRPIAQDLAEANFANADALSVSLVAGQLMNSVEIVAYKVPLIEVDNTTSRSTVTGEAIRSLPTKNINAIAASAIGISPSNGEAITIRGSRSNGTIYYVDGVRVDAPLIRANAPINPSDHYLRNKVHDSRQALAQTDFTPRRKRTSNTTKFYVPQYNSTVVTPRTDFRQTIYWNPRVQTDDQGHAQVVFYTSDEVTSFSLIGEGVSISGDPGRSNATVVNTKPLSIDCKLPTYMVLGDTALLSVVVENRTSNPETIRLSADAGTHVTLNIKGEQDVTIDANSIRVFTIEAVPLEVGYGQLNIAAAGREFSDFLTKRYEVTTPYFPLYVSTSGSTSTTDSIEIQNMIPGSISANYQLYNPVEGALDGIEAMLRSPGGCFEQVSSATYPNVMIYQYLQTSHTSDQTIKNKAIQYIVDGYDRLIAYETTEDGFDWWGRAPGHVALTAYGLLEFIDMAQVYNRVDTRMLQRTVDFLLKKRDHKGGFEMSKGYDGFGSAIYDIQNAYVVYALSKQNVKTIDIEPEYKKALETAKSSKDPYQCALLALSAYHLNKIQDYGMMMQIIKSKIKTDGIENLKGKTTITRSGQRDNNTETLAWYALAMMSDKNADLAEILPLIYHIANKRKHGRFGSTQATCLAIQAILSYAQFSPPSNSKETITAQLNGVDISPGLLNTALLSSTQLLLNIDMPENSNKSYGIDIKYLTSLPPSHHSPSLDLKTELSTGNTKRSDIITLSTTVINNRDQPLANPTLIIGIPSGTSLNMKQLENMKDDGLMNYFEIHQNQLVIYLDQLEAAGARRYDINLTADIAGSYQAPPSRAYLYYDEGDIIWATGVKCSIASE